MFRSCLQVTPSDYANNNGEILTWDHCLQPAVVGCGMHVGSQQHLHRLPSPLYVANKNRPSGISSSYSNENTINGPRKR